MNLHCSYINGFGSWLCQFGENDWSVNNDATYNENVKMCHFAVVQDFLSIIHRPTCGQTHCFCRVVGFCRVDNLFLLANTALNSNSPTPQSERLCCVFHQLFLTDFLALFKFRFYTKLPMIHELP